MRSGGNSFFYVDCKPTDDIQFIRERELDRITSGEFIFPFCSLCNNPAQQIITWLPESGQERASMKVPQGITRLVFFPICERCMCNPLAGDELKWKSTETLHCNVPLESVGFNYHH